jgi:hypothetical protein
MKIGMDLRKLGNAKQKERKPKPKQTTELPPSVQDAGWEVPPDLPKSQAQWQVSGSVLKCPTEWCGHRMCSECKRGRADDAFWDHRMFNQNEPEIEAEMERSRVLQQQFPATPDDPRSDDCILCCNCHRTTNKMRWLLEHEFDNDYWPREAYAPPPADEDLRINPNQRRVLEREAGIQPQVLPPRPRIETDQGKLLANRGYKPKPKSIETKNEPKLDSVEGVPYEQWRAETHWNPKLGTQLRCPDCGHEPCEDCRVGSWTSAVFDFGDQLDEPNGSYNLTGRHPELQAHKELAAGWDPESRETLGMFIKCCACHTISIASSWLNGRPSAVCAGSVLPVPTPAAQPDSSSPSQTEKE